MRSVMTRIFLVIVKLSGLFVLTISICSVFSSTFAKILVSVVTFLRISLVPLYKNTSFEGSRVFYVLLQVSNE